MSQDSTTSAAVLLAIVVVAVVFVAGAFSLADTPGAEQEPTVNDDRDRFAGTTGLNGPVDNPDLSTFDSTEAFQEYFETASQRRVGFGGMMMRGTVDVQEQAVEETTDAAPPEGGDDGGVSGSEDGASGSSDASGGEGTERHSETNVQEAALDEPDVLKTDGESVYYAGHHFQQTAHETTVLDISDPAEPERAATIPAAGELLLIEESDTLVVFEEERIWAYDISDPSSPTQRWDEPIDSDLQTARLYDGSLYLVFVDRPQADDPCPIVPYAGETVECTDIYRPSTQANADAVYTATQVDPGTGEIEGETSVVGSSRTSAMYVSEKAIYLSYTRSTTRFEMLTSYITGPGSDNFDADLVAEVEDLQKLDISQRAKQTELDVIVEDWLHSLDEAERNEMREALEEGLQEYVEENKRAMTTTGIVSIDIGDGLDVSATGEVPGYPLNQWSMDEHDDHLRIATTIPQRRGAESENDVYVLDENLEITGSVEGLGETERIYSVRFEGDLGYVVTFRQIDPFYTLDLSDPANPIMEGELKIPGVSHYLHPLEDEGDLVLGVGEEDGKVKLSTFDVSDRTDPTEEDVRILEGERFSEANQNHRAFLQDERHGVFFMPAGENSYVFSYENGQLKEEASVDVGGAGVRAMYVDDYLYVFGTEEIVVLDETTWEVETRIDGR